MSKETRRYGRFNDVVREFSLKRGTTRNLIASGKIRAKRVRATDGRGVILIDLESVAAFIEAQPDA